MKVGIFFIFLVVIVSASLFVIGAYNIFLRPGKTIEELPPVESIEPYLGEDVLQFIVN